MREDMRFRPGIGFLKVDIGRWKYSFLPAKGNPLTVQGDEIVRAWCREQWPDGGWEYTGWLSCLSTDDHVKATDFRLRWC